MKTTKSPENAEITPSKKKLKQARLPFKLLSDVSPKPDGPPTRKRKLSEPEVEPVTKLGKISKENSILDESIVISDEDSQDAGVSKNDKLPNPYVKLVDTARMKKLQKSKKKKNSKKFPKVVKGSCELQTDCNNKESELMDLDEPPNTENMVSSAIDNTETIKVNADKIINSSFNEENKEEFNSVKGANIGEKVVSKDSSTNDTENNKAKDLLKERCDELIHDSLQENNGDDLKLIQGEKQVTPKRSTRIKTQTEQNNNSKSSPNTKSSELELNDSICSTPSTPKNSRSSSVTMSQGDKSLNESSTSANLTPKQIQKKLESAKKKEEREKEKLEREKKRQLEKEEKAKLKQDKEEQRKREREEKEEAKRKEKEEKEELKRKEKEEKEKQRELEKKQREEKEEQKRKEREEKEELKRKEKEAKEEEKRKKQEALELEKQEQELKKKKAAEAFVNFFVPKQKSEKDQAIICSVNNSMLSNFTIKTDMRLAPLVRVSLTDDKKSNLDIWLEKQSEEVLYLKSLKDGLSKPMFNGKTWPLSDKDDDDVMIVEDSELPPIDGAAEILASDSVPREKLRPKLLSFHENRRPPYWGTWRKKSVSIKPRKPFGQDQKQIDYEVDSDDDWEEEQEGESIDGSAAGSDDEQDGDEYEVDNVVFVPHGYLSDEEATMDEDEVQSLSPETQQARLKHLEDEFESEMKKPTEKLKPRMYGLIWETADGGKPEKCADALWNYFSKMAMIMNDPTQLLIPSTVPEESEKKKWKKKKTGTQADGELKQRSPKNEKSNKTKSDDKEIKIPKSDTKKVVADTKKNQPGINVFLTKVKSS